MRDVALVPERDVFESNETNGANDARHAANALRDDRIALMRHRARTLLSFSKTFLRFAYFGALPVPNVQSKLLQRGGDRRERTEILGINVALDHLRRDRRRFQTKPRANFFFNRRIEVCKRADRAADLSYRDSVFRTQQPLAVAAHLVEPQRKRQTERRR